MRKFPKSFVYHQKDSKFPFDIRYLKCLRNIYIFCQCSCSVDQTVDLFDTLFIKDCVCGQIKYLCLISKGVSLLIIFIAVSGSCTIHITVSLLLTSTLILTLPKKISLNLEKEGLYPILQLFRLSSIWKIPKQKHDVILKLI